MSFFDLPTRETFRFIEPFLAQSKARILEIGCGDGRLASHLKSQGYDIVALDQNPRAVQSTREKGITAVESSFLEYHSSPFDVLLFNCSLHHIVPLDENLKHAKSLLKGDGLLIANEFDCDHMDGVTAEWFYRMKSLLIELKIIALEKGHGNPLKRWQAHHSHHTPPINTGSDLKSAIQKEFFLLKEQRSAYLYQYYYYWMPPTPKADGIAQEILEMENHLIQHRAIAPIGLQIVAKN